MTLQEIKNQIRSFFPGKTQVWINGKVKEITNGGDLRKKSTWDYALNLLRANEIEELPSIGVKTEKISRSAVETAIAMIDALPVKQSQPVQNTSKTVITQQQVESTIQSLEALPMREIKPNVFIFGSVQPARALVA